MNSTGGELLVLSQQPSSWKSHGSQKFSCSFQNSVEFPQKRDINTSANPSASEDDLQITKGTILGDHHVVEAFLGEGGFGLVTRCRDTKNNKTVAIKVNKSDPEILLQAKLEIFILEQLRRLDPDRCNIVEWNGYFLDGERICLNFELLDQSLWDYIGDRNNQGLPMRELRPILHQLANALFHLGSVGIVHADLKPGNIMVVNRSESPVKVKLIDFGLACPASAVIPGDRVGTIGYCAPEVMLGIPYDKPKTITSTKTTSEYAEQQTTYHHISPSIRPTTNVFLLSPQPVAADGRPDLSLVLPEVSSCKKGVFPSHCRQSACS
uniref:Protein kinase domain-containing protein n=1 Tax=Astatotilapia calliptera TaxID=8154 RepID=A0A3P8RHQ8_ASTCA